MAESPAVGQLAGHPAVFQHALAADQFPGLFGGGAGAGGLGGLFKDGLGHAGVLLKELGQLGVDEVGDQGADLGVAELRFGLPLELRLLQLDRDDADQPLPHVRAGQVLVLVFQQPVAPPVVVEHPGQTGPEALFVGAAVGGVDVVGKAEQQFVVAGVVLHGDLSLGAVGFGRQIDDAGVQHLEVPLFVQVGDKAADAALVAHHLLPVAGDALLPILEDGGVQLPLVGQGDLEPRVEEALFPQALFKGVEVEVGGLAEHLGVGLEGDLGAGRAVGGGPHLMQRAVGVAAAEGLLVLLAVPPHLHSQPLGAGVDHRRAHAVQAAGYLVARVLAAELAAGVQDGKDDGDRRQPGVGLDAHRDAAPVVGDLDDVALFDLDLDVVAVAGQRLIDRIVHDLIDQVVQPALAGRADVHARPFADRLQALQHLDLTAVVLVVGGGVGAGDPIFCHCISPSYSLDVCLFQKLQCMAPV